MLIPQSQETLRSFAGVVLADNPVINVLHINNLQKYEKY